MTPLGYIYVTDQGRVFASGDEPTDEDLAYAQVGMVTIIRLADYHFYGTGHTWTSVAPGQLGPGCGRGCVDATVSRGDIGIRTGCPDVGGSRRGV